MTTRTRPTTTLLFALLTVVLCAPQAFAQKFGGGKETSGAEVIDDGFRPVWAQQRKVVKPAAKVQPKPQQAVAPKQQLAENKAAPAELPANMTVHGRWTVTCNDAEAGNPKRACSAALRIVDSRQQLVILWEIGRATDGAMKAVLQTPTGVLVQRGVDLKIGEAQVGKFDYAACVPQNCEAGGALDEALLTKMVSASEMMLTIHAKDGRDVNFKFPVNGIDAALAAVRS